MSDSLFVGVDLGGTSIKIGLCNEAGDLLRTHEGPTQAADGTDAVLSNIATYVKELVTPGTEEWDAVVGVGIGVAGFLNIPEGIISFSANLPFRNVPIKQIMEEKIGKPVKINNDANVAALGEAWGGAGKNIANCVCYTLGTGVGGGIILNNRLIEGFAGMAGELGHMSIVADLEAIQCGCSKMGCLETVSSATGIIRMAKDAVERGDRTSLMFVEGELSAKDVFDAAKGGDEVSQRIVSRAAFYLGKSMAAVAIVVNPQRFIIGGGVSKAGEYLFTQIREVFNKLTPDHAKDGVEIVAAELGNNAGVVGAAGLFLRA